MGVWVHDARRLALGFALFGVTVTGIAGCTSQQATPGTMLAPVSSSGSTTAAGTSQVAPTTRSSFVVPSSHNPGGEVTGASSVSAVMTSEDDPWSDLDLTEAQIADARAAVDAYIGYRRISDLTFTDPKRDWAPEVYKYAADPVASNLLKFVADPAFQQGSGAGLTKVDPRVTSVATNSVELGDCVDNSESTFVDSNGNSLIAPDAPGFYRRHPASVSISRQDNQWLVTAVVNDFTVQC